MHFQITRPLGQTLGPRPLGQTTRAMLVTTTLASIFVSPLLLGMSGQSKTMFLWNASWLRERMCVCLGATVCVVGRGFVQVCMHKHTHAIHLIITRAVPGLYLNNLRRTHAFSNHDAVGTTPRVNSPVMDAARQSWTLRLLT